jgi:adenosylcobinamide-phosphate synthase
LNFGKDFRPPGTRAAVQGKAGIERLRAGVIAFCEEMNVLLFWPLQEILWMTIAAVLVDLAVGDPRRIPHPVVIIGRGIGVLEKWLYAPEGRTRRRLNGAVLVGIVVIASFAVVSALLIVAEMIHPWLFYAAQVWLISTTLAAKGLKDAAMDVYRRLRAGDLAEARKRVGMIVGRDTANMDEREVTRAAVETVAENTVDAFVSPLFFALLGGAPLAMLYRAANTLDSMIGYKNERYIHFGWAAARFDDVLNYVPARLCGLMAALAAMFVPGMSAARTVQSVRRFARLHPSPNSGIPEAAFAGAIGIQLGGINVYGGKVSKRAHLGWPLKELAAADIQASVRLLYMIVALFLGVLLCALLAAGVG